MRQIIKIYIIAITCILGFNACENTAKPAGNNVIDFNFRLADKKLKSSGLDYVGVPLITQKDKVLDWSDDSIDIKIICLDSDLSAFQLTINDDVLPILSKSGQSIDLLGLNGLVKIELCKSEKCITQYLNLTDNIGNEELDSDGDGIADIEDKCPLKGRRGSIDKFGCPQRPKPNSVTPPSQKDSDNDGFIDSEDYCPTVYSTTNNGCPVPDKDSDGDGILDKRDRCPNSGELGEVDVNGCPVVKDRDGDGFMDERDKCPDEFSKTNNGCPEEDSDGDGVEDRLDRCPTEGSYGNVDVNGCPKIKDTDGDGLIDAEDRCPQEGEKGKVDKNGCPYLRRSGSVINADDSCFSDHQKANRIFLMFEVKQRLKLSSIELYTLTKWDNASISVKTEDGSLIGNQINNERILPGSDISLEGLGVKLNKGNYVLEIKGAGDAFDIKECISGSQSNEQISIRSNSNFFNLVYRY